MILIRSAVFSLSALLSFASLVRAQVPLCDNVVRVSTDPPPLSSSQPSSEIDWWADAHKVGSPAADTYQMTRVVIDRSSQARKVSWPIGRMTVLLQPGAWARHCPPPSGGRGRNIVGGPIYFRSNGAFDPSEVYENVGESAELRNLEGQPLNFPTTFQIGPAEGSPSDQGLRFTAVASFDPAQKKYILKYTVLNIGKTDEYITIKDLPLNADVRGQLQPLPPGKAASFEIRTETIPFSKWVQVGLKDKVGVMDATIEVRAAVPQPPKQ